MSDWPLKHDGSCACRFVRREEMDEAEQVAWCALHAKQRDALAELAKYFTSGNSVPVERATILAKDFWRITGLEPSNASFSRGPSGPSAGSDSCTSVADTEDK